MTNYFYPDETVSENDLYFMCAMVERIARKRKLRNRNVVNHIGEMGLRVKLSLADVLHCENPDQVIDDFVEEFEIPTGDFDISAVNTDITPKIPTALQMGKVYKRLILATLNDGEDYAQAMIRVYNDPICDVIDDYSCAAYYEPSYVITRAYYAGGFE